MFDPNRFLDTPAYTHTPAAQMALTVIGYNGILDAETRLHAEHRATCRDRVPLLTSCTGAFVTTHGGYSLVVVDSILPLDYSRRTVICMDTEVDDVRVKMFRAAGLIPDRSE